MHWELVARGVAICSAAVALKIDGYWAGAVYSSVTRSRLFQSLDVWEVSLRA
jgi:hypothetical protein